MPKAKNATTTEALLPSKMVVRYKARRVFMVRPKKYEELLEKIRGEFMMAPLRQLRLLGTVEGAQSLQHVEIGKTLWSTSNEKVKTIKVETLDDPIRINLDAPVLPISHSSGRIPNKGLGAPPSQMNGLTETKPSLHGLKLAAQPPVDPSTASILASAAAPSTIRIPPTSENYSDKITIYIVSSNGSSFGLQIRPNSTFDRVFKYVAAKIGKCEGEISLLYDGERVRNNDTPNSLGVEHGEVLDVYIIQVGGKPVIYLYPPQEMDVSVRLGLVPQWRFSALYPPTPIKETSPGQSVEWSVRALPDGLMKDYKTGVHVSYLFWEAETQPAVRPDSPPASRPTTPNQVTSSIPPEIFVPNSSHCSPSNSVLLEIDALPLYLDRALSSLGLHVEARTSFITYWLPSMLKHRHIAMRFVPQNAYEPSAPLTITPSPDVVTRVFMLFQGIKGDRLADWTEAADRATEAVDLWRGVVGTPPEASQKDESLFRVLEWGGMEVLGR